MKTLSRILFSAILAMALGMGIAGTVRAQSSTDSSMGAKASKAAAAVGEKLDINSATKEQLDALPGVGSAYAEKIIAGRRIAPSATWSPRRSFRNRSTKRSKTRSLPITPRQPRTS